MKKCVITGAECTHEVCAKHGLSSCCRYCQDFCEDRCDNTELWPYIAT